MQNVYEKGFKTEIPMRQNIWNPKNWTIFCKLNLILSIVLLIDWMIGLLIPNLMYSRSYLYSILPDSYLFLIIVPLFSIIAILILSPLLNEKLDKSPFFIAILISIILSIGINQYTIVGYIGRTILSLSMAIVLALFCINITILENKEPISNIGAVILGILLVMINLIVSIIVFGIRLNEVWGIFFALIAIFGAILMRMEYIKLGGIPIFICCVLNDYLLPFGLSGFNAGVDLLSFISLFMVAYDFMRK